MRRISFFFSIFAACAPLFAVPTPAAAGDTASLGAAIKAENARWAEAFGRGDYKAIGRLYTEDGALLPPGESKIMGAGAITEYFTRGYAGSRPATVSFSNDEFYGNDQTVTEVSDAEIRDHSGKVIFRGKQILVFLKRDGSWKLHRDIWNRSAP